ncbi:MAG TPA: hypothetical protein VEI06_09145 [Gemmatimonadaceae bacterium]|nr:hypothetical protein [Gemmatimonadaceae bacterium]
MSNDRALDAMRRAAVRWEPLGAPPPTALAEARGQLHHALQITTAVAISLLAPAPDDSHTNHEWVAESRLYATRVIAAPRPFRAALRPADLSLLIVDGAGHGENAFALHGRTVDDAYGWLTRQLKASGADPGRLTRRKHYEIPPHAVASGAAFDLGDGAAFAELARWWRNANAILRALSGAIVGSDPVRCWPHHFDLATILPVDGQRTRSIGVGLSPGDEWYAEPYFYVSPHPPPEGVGLPALPSGRWHTRGWTGAVLTGSAITASGEEAGDVTTRFLDSATAASRAALARSGAS